MSTGSALLLRILKNEQSSGTEIHNVIDIFIMRHFNRVCTVTKNKNEQSSGTEIHHVIDIFIMRHFNRVYTVTKN